MTKKRIISIVKNYRHRLKEANIPVIAIYLFGSAAKGLMRKGSDIDLCVVSPLFGKDRQEERIILMNLQDGVSDLIEPHPFSPKDFTNKFDPLVREIKKTGVKLT